MEEKFYDLPITSEVLTNMATAGKALKLYVWLVNKTTRKGGVLGGKTITLEYMAGEMKVSLRTIKRYFKQVKPLLELKRVPFGYKIKVKGLDKWHKNGKSDRSENGTSSDIATQDNEEKRSAKNGTSGVPKMALAIEPYKKNLTSVTNVTESEDKKPSSLTPKQHVEGALHREVVITPELEKVIMDDFVLQHGRSATLQEKKAYIEYYLSRHQVEVAV